MADTTFVDQQTPIVASWLNDVNVATYRYLNYVYMVANANGTWTVYAPFGGSVTTSSSTTNGFQEALNYALTSLGTRGYPLHIIGGDAGTGGAIVINCTTPTTFPATQGKTIIIEDCTINVTGAVGSANGLTFDSAMMHNLRTPGSQVVYGGTGYAISFKPVHQVPLDAITAVTDSTFEFQSIGMTNNSAAGGVYFDQSSAPIGGFKFKIQEIEGTNCTGSGIVISNGTHGIQNITFEIGRIHGFTGTLLQVGTRGTNNTISGNKFIFTSLDPGTGSNPVIDVYGTNNYFQGVITAAEGTPAVGIQLETAATGNVFDIPLNQATTPVVDVAAPRGNNTNVGVSGPGACTSSVILSGNQTGVVTATPTLVAFSTGTFNDSGAFNLTSHKWIPGKFGRVRISATVTWTASVDGSGMYAAVYKNGSAIKSPIVISKGTGAQSCSVECTSSVDALTDYFQIYAYQATGSNQTIDGNSFNTYADFNLIRER